MQYLRANPAAPKWAREAARTIDGVDESWLPNDHTAVLGCGHYGCVFAVPDESMVLKLTTDPTEVEFVKRAMAIGEWPEGIVRYLAVAELDGTYRKRRIYAVWREAAREVGLPALFGQQQDYENRALAVFGERLTQFKAIAAVGQAALVRAKDPAKIRAEAAQYENWAWENVGYDAVEGRRTEWGKRAYNAFFLRFRGARRVAAALRGCAIVAELMEHEYLSDLVGGALRFYLEQGILLADVHSANVGTVVRDDYPDPVWVITDPGHAVSVQEEFS